MRIKVKNDEEMVEFLNQYSDEELTLYSPEELIHEYLEQRYSKKALFAGLESELGRKPTLYDYHCLYRNCLEGIIFSVYKIELFYRLTCKHDESLMNELLEKYHNKIKELDNIFNEYAAKIGNSSDIPIGECVKNMSEAFTAITKYYNNHVTVKSQNETSIIQESQQAKKLPSVVQEILKSEYFSDTPIDGKYSKKNGIKDQAVIKWLFDYYPDTGKELTADIYYQYIHTELKPQTIGQYISRSSGEAK